MRDVSKEYKAESFTPLFATVSLVLFIGIIVLTLYSKNIMNEFIHKIILKDSQISALKRDLKDVDAHINFLEEDLIKLQSKEIPSDKEKEYRSSIVTKNSEIAKLEAEIITYEAILSKSNILTRALIKKVGDCENEKKK